MTDELVIVYNADSTVFAQLSDYFHKIVSPETYDCNLCKITYGNFGMEKKWKKFIESRAEEFTFLHKNELKKKHPGVAKTALPAVFKKEDGQLKLIVSAKEINQAKNLEDLIDLFKRKT